MTNVYPHLTDRVTLVFSDLFKVTQVVTFRIKTEILTTAYKVPHEFPSKCCSPHPIPHTSLSVLSLFILQYVVLPSTTGPFLPQAICCRCHVCFPLLFAKYYLFILRILVQLSSPKEVYGALKIAHYFA